SAGTGSARSSSRRANRQPASARRPRAPPRASSALAVVVTTSSRPSSIDEPGNRVGVVRVAVVENLDGHVLADHRVAGLVDLAEATRADALADHVTGNGIAARQARPGRRSVR